MSALKVMETVRTRRALYDHIGRSRPVQDCASPAVIAAPKGGTYQTSGDVATLDHECDALVKPLHGYHITQRTAPA